MTTGKGLLTRRGFVALGTALLAGSRPAFAQMARLPDLGDAASAALPPAEDIKLGKAFMRQVRAQTEVINDPEIADYIQWLGDLLASQSDGNPAGFHYYVIEDPAINSFAGPGGHVCIFTGLIKDTQSEGELAAVVAHETGHVLQHHIARGMEMSKRWSIPVLAGLVAAVVLGIGTRSSSAASAAAAAATGGSMQAQLGFSRSIEEEADEVGMQLLHGAGFDPHAMPDFFERMEQATRYWSTPPPFLLDHPVTSARIADSRARADQYPKPDKPYRSDFSYYLFKGKIAVLTEPDFQKAVDDARARLSQGEYAKKAAAQYRLALALERLGKYDEARALLTSLRRESPDSIWYRCALARVETGAGRLAVARRLYGDGLNLYPDNRALLTGYVEVLLRTQEPAKAVRIMEDYKRNHALDAPLYDLLARCYNAAGKRGESLLALAEHDYLSGHLDQAIRQLERARAAAAGDFYISSRVDARLQDLREERKALKKSSS